MQFFSTRDQNRKVTSSQAIAQGLSDEGGLFVPASFPQVDVKALCGLDYPALAAAVVREYLTDYDPAFLTDATRSTYGAAFGGKAGYLAPVEGDTYALELWHGPTCAFKDYALQLMPKLLVEAKKNLGRTEKTLILVATSGDTGKAALDGYHDIPGVEIAVFYPTGGTSEIQRLQMATQEGANVAVYAVRGNFDDAQTGVKKVFGDKAIAAELEKPGRDPRDELPAPVLRTDVLSMEDLKPGMELTGTVRNVIDFGAFVDIGVHQDGLVHISRMADRFIRHPSEVVRVGDVVTVWVVDVDVKKQRIALSMVKGRA